MRRSHLEKVYYKNKSEKSFKAFAADCISNLNPSFVTDNKLLWKTIKPFFSNKGNYRSHIKLVEKEKKGIARR